MYSAYMNEFKVAMTTMARYEQSSEEFREQLVLCQHSSSCEGLSLASYLLTPVQRLPRYELLMKVRVGGSGCSTTEETHPHTHLLIIHAQCSTG